MRTLALAAAVMLTASCAFAAPATKPAAPKAAAPAASPVQFKNDLVTLELNDAPLKSALEQLFKAAGKSYTLTDGAKMWMESLKPTVQVRIQNAQFDDALKAVLGNYGYSVENGIYTIMDPEYYAEDYLPSLQKATPPAQMPPVGVPVGGVPTGIPGGGYGGVTQGVGPYGSSYGPPKLPDTPAIGIRLLELPAMPVEEAYKKVLAAATNEDPLGWKFADNLGKTIMPGARFSGLSLQNAAEMVVIAAGLVPPVEPSKTVEKKAPTGATPMPRFVRPYFPHTGGPGLSWGAYKTATSDWRYMLVSSNVSASQLLAALFEVTDKNYSIATGIGDKKITARLTDVNLNQALKAILSPLQMTYRIEGDVYVIQEKDPSASKTEPAPDPQPDK